MTWSELPNYKDVVIPKTELYYRKKLEERVDVSVEIHLWRRKLAILKRFKFDLLTRDNIKFFKQEANIFMTLSHANIVSFYGVVIDPPSLGIVMQYCSKGDLFKELEKKRTQLQKSSFATESKHEGHNYDEGDIAMSQLSSQVATSRQSLMVTEMHLIKSLTEFSEESMGVINPMSAETMPTENDDETFPSRNTSWTKLVKSLSSRTSITEYQKFDKEFDPILCALQVARGMLYLHSQGINHCDLKVFPF